MAPQSWVPVPFSHVTTTVCLVLVCRYVVLNRLGDYGTQISRHICTNSSYFLGFLSFEAYVKKKRVKTTGYLPKKKWKGEWNSPDTRSARIFFAGRQFVLSWLGAYGTHIFRMRNVFDDFLRFLLVWKPKPKKPSKGLWLLTWKLGEKEDSPLIPSASTFSVRQHRDMFPVSIYICCAQSAWGLRDPDLPRMHNVFFVQYCMFAFPVDICFAK